MGEVVSLTAVRTADREADLRAQLKRAMQDYNCGDLSALRRMLRINHEIRQLLGLPGLVGGTR